MKTRIGNNTAFEFPTREELALTSLSRQLALGGSNIPKSLMPMRILVGDSQEAAEKIFSKLSELMRKCAWAGYGGICVKIGKDSFGDGVFIARRHACEPHCPSLPVVLSGRQRAGDVSSILARLAVDSGFPVSGFRMECYNVAVLSFEWVDERLRQATCYDEGESAISALREGVSIDDIVA